MLKNILEVNGLGKSFHTSMGALNAVEKVSFRVREGMTLGVLGESGSGKSTLARCVLRLLEPDRGQIRFDGEDITYLPHSELRRFRSKAQMIFQNPYAAMNPRMTISESLRDPFRIWELGSRAEQDEKIDYWLHRVGLEPKTQHRYPDQFSGGQLQRINIARALIVEPKLLVCDEAVSSLDVSIQSQILDLLMELQDEHHLSYIFISHDLGIVEAISDEVLVMRNGRQIELSSVDEVFRYPKEEYTQTLVAGQLRMPSMEDLLMRAATRKGKSC